MKDPLSIMMISPTSKWGYQKEIGIQSCIRNMLSKVSADIITSLRGGTTTSSASNTGRGKIIYTPKCSLISLETGLSNKLSSKNKKLSNSPTELEMMVKNTIINLGNCLIINTDYNLNYMNNKDIQYSLIAKCRIAILMKMKIK